MTTAAHLQPGFWRRKRNWLLLALILFTLSSIGSAGYIYAQWSELPSEDGTVTVLLMGTDAREGEEIDIGVRPDVLAVLHLDDRAGTCRLLSIPRDTRVELPGYGQSKINHALAVEGIPYQRDVVEGLLGIEIDRHAAINFAGLEDLVDALGGVTIENAVAFSLNGHDFPVGTLTLNGEEALYYSRYRGGPDGDFGRIERQQRVVRAMLSQTSGMEVITGVRQLYTAVDRNVRTDLTLIEAAGLAMNHRETCSGATLQTETLSGDVMMLPDELYGQDLSFVVVDPEELTRKVNWLRTGE